MKIAVVILNYNGAALLHDLLPKVVEFSPQAEVIVADNASTDDSLAVLRDEFPQVRLIQLEKNFGFAEGYNRALAQIDAEVFVLLNSDVEVTPNWLVPMVDYLGKHPEVAACQPKLMSYNHRTQFEYAGACGGQIDMLGYPFCRGRILDTVEEDRGQYDEVADIFWATGACLCIRADRFREVGGLDGRFFAHMEEIDLCWRLGARGHRIVCVPQSVVYHIGAKTLNAESPFKTYLNFRNCALMIYKNSLHAHCVLFVRFWLDMVAALHLLLQRKPKNAAAVLRALHDFHRMRSDFKKDRDKNLKKTVVARPAGFFADSILWQYYFRKRKVARDLPKLG